MKRIDVNLLVLAAARDAELSPVQLQKALFLIGQKCPEMVSNDYYTFVPYHYGPFDKQVYRDVETLQRQGLAKESASTWKSYRATEAGRQHAHDIELEIPSLARYVEQLVGWVRDQSFEELLRAVYTEFPTYKSQSIFRG